ncbi:Ctf8p SCDLUD_004366 [Saccharomycodes ludwigii]|uniref:Ctf8p n=1 Tax=Saccharomycodes ludwigii TaxID=36035 RepID=UPI001E84F6D7|nr:hypothetical protein SCDLUD_004366 [Saccharomycodes ludwigii]KAH3900048.1 hypothetical protein SCDLUD_004366 [Saccharomycodes ludwigii]
MPSTEVKIQDNILEHPQLGCILIEIQGDLEIDLHQFKEDPDRTMQFGKLEILDDNHVVLFIGKKQRLLGHISKLDPPVALLKFSNSTEAINNSINNNKQSNVEILRIIKNKMVFRDRPLPIM